MVNAVDPFTESLDTQVLASFSAAAASLSFLLATYKLTAATTKLYQNMKDLFISGKISKNSWVESNLHEPLSIFPHTLVQSMTDTIGNC